MERQARSQWKPGYSVSHLGSRCKGRRTEGQKVCAGEMGRTRTEDAEGAGFRERETSSSLSIEARGEGDRTALVTLEAQ